MYNVRSKSLGLAVVAIVLSSSALGTEKPVSPPPNVPDLKAVKPIVVCVDCDEPFDTTTHKKILEGLLNNPYVAQLRKALYLQDSYHQFESKVHFDNCDFDDASSYIAELLKETDSHVTKAQRAKADNKTEEMQKSAADAFFALGQALHGIQDFYAHSNYVELQAPKVKAVTDIEIVPTWTAKGQERITALQNEGLVSGYVWWGAPQKCPSGTMSHEKLAKDSAQTVSGKRVVPHLQNYSQYRIASFLAREASLKFLAYSFKRWPLLKELNGENLAFETLVDRRNGLE